MTCARLPCLLSVLGLLLGAAIGTVPVPSAHGQQAPPAAQQDRPNIVVILMDNLGYGELGVYGGGVLRGAPTPRIDQLAREGMRLLNFNVEAQCSIQVAARSAKGRDPWCACSSHAS